MDTSFIVVSLATLAATGLALLSKEAIRALLFFVLSLLGVAVLFLRLGAAFAAALEIIVYAGAIVVLIVFVTMMVGRGTEPRSGSLGWTAGVLAVLLAMELGAVLDQASGGAPAGGPGRVSDLGRSLFGPYLLGVEIASLLLLAGLVAACHASTERKRGREEP